MKTNPYRQQAPIARTLNTPLIVALALAAVSCDAPQDGDLDAFEDEAIEQVQDKPEELVRVERLAPRMLDARRQADDPEETPSVVRRAVVDRSGRTHVRVGQTYQGVPVFGAEAIVHLNADETLRRVTDDFLDNIAVDTTPELDEEEAVRLAVEHAGGEELVSSEPEVDLQILRRERVDYLVYRVQLRQFEPGETPAMPVLFIDGHTGELVNSYDNLQHIDLSDSDAETRDMDNGTDFDAADIADSSDAVANNTHKPCPRTHWSSSRANWVETATTTREPRPSPSSTSTLTTITRSGTAAA